ncbi:MAG: pyridoxamine 5'-phosphate oxidase family protein [Planctomycetota bacterium]|jgi:general stress protein 26
MSTDQELGRRALDIVSDAQLGIFMTCDEDGHPHGRWMAALPVQGLHWIYSLTARGTRKLEHIARHPEVSWIFTRDQEEIVLLKGRASVDGEFQGTRDVWDRLASVTQRYAVGPLSDDDHLELVTVKTRVEQIEVISPPMGAHVAGTIPVEHAS